MNLPPWLNPLLSVERKWRYFFNHLRVHFPVLFPWKLLAISLVHFWIRVSAEIYPSYLPSPPSPTQFRAKVPENKPPFVPRARLTSLSCLFLSHRRSNKNSTTSVFETGVCLLKRTFQVLKKWTQASLKSKLVIGVQDQHRRSLSCKGLRVQPGSNLIEQNNPIVLVLLHFACDWSWHFLNQSDANLNQSRLGRPRFPALW